MGGRRVCVRDDPTRQEWEAQGRIRGFDALPHFGPLLLSNHSTEVCRVKLCTGHSSVERRDDRCCAVLTEPSKIIAKNHILAN